MSTTRLAQRLLIIGWDAAEWKIITPLLDSGQLPNLARFVETGVMGNIATLQPCLSPILWTSIATGKTADQHGICGFVEPLADGGGVCLASSTSRKTKALWNIFSQSGLKVNVVGWFATHPAEPINGVCVSNLFTDCAPDDPRTRWLLPPQSVHPPELAQAIAELRVHPAEIRPADLRSFIPRIDEIELRRDPRPARLARVIAQCASVHAVTTGAMDAEPWDVTLAYYDALDAAGHLFMPYHPPRMDHVPERDFEIYRNVIAELYRFHDQMLGRLLELAGDECAVMLLSDHGFHSDHLRPTTIAMTEMPEAQAAAWHRPYGIFAMRGPRIRRDERVYGATLLDIAPTALTLMGLPVGQDMHGKVLIDAVEGIIEIERIPSWDERDGDSGMHPPLLRQDPIESAAAIQHLVQLGYLASAPSDAGKLVEIASAEWQFNLACVHQAHGRAEPSLRILEPLAAAHPREPRYVLALARARVELNQYEQARIHIEGLEQQGFRSADSDLLLSSALFNMGQTAAAQDRLLEAEQRYPPTPTLNFLIGSVHLAQRRWPDAEKSLRRAIDLDDDFAQAHEGLAQALLEQAQYEAAANHALRAVGLLHYFPRAHYFLGAALAGMGETARAARAMEVAVAMAPNFAEAHRRLAELYTQLGDPTQAMRHQQLARTAH